MWNRKHIAYVQIDVPETLAIEGRADFYDHAGAYRDMIVTHLFQVLGFLAMEPPVSLDARHLATRRQVRDVRYGLALRRHQHHDRRPHLHRVFGRAANLLQAPALGHRDRTKTSRGTPITTSGNSPVTSLAHPLEINDAQRSWPALHAASATLGLNRLARP